MQLQAKPGVRVQPDLETTTIGVQLHSTLDLVVGVGKVVDHVFAHLRAEGVRVASSPARLGEDETALVCEIGEALGAVREACVRVEVLERHLRDRGSLPANVEPVGPDAALAIKVELAKLASRINAQASALGLSLPLSAEDAGAIPGTDSC